MAVFHLSLCRVSRGGHDARNLHLNQANVPVLCVPPVTPLRVSVSEILIVGLRAFIDACARVESNLYGEIECDNSMSPRKKNSCDDE